jgi:hypothetical protein
VSEGMTFLKGREDQIFRTNIGLIMICVAHGKNTVSKEEWLKQPFDEFPNYYAHKKILKEIIVSDTSLTLVGNSAKEIIVSDANMISQHHTQETPPA